MIHVFEASTILEDNVFCMQLFETAAKDRSGQIQPLEPTRCSELSSYYQFLFQAVNIKLFPRPRLFRFRSQALTIQLPDRAALISLIVAKCLKLIDPLPLTYQLTSHG
jgi:hypothetical protein